MNVALLAGVLKARADLRSHDRWSRDTLVDHQARSLGELRRFAVANSPFYRQLMPDSTKRRWRPCRS